MIATWFCSVMHYEFLWVFKKQDYESFYRDSGERSYKSLKIIFLLEKNSRFEIFLDTVF